MNRPLTALRSRPRWRRFFAALAVVVLASHCHLTSMAIQSIGWAYMFTTFVQEGPAAEALEKTFNGESPCGFCHAAEALAETAEPSSDEELRPAPRSVNTVLFAAAAGDDVPVFADAGPTYGAVRVAYDLAQPTVDPLPG